MKRTGLRAARSILPVLLAVAFSSCVAPRYAVLDAPVEPGVVELPRDEIPVMTWNIRRLVPTDLSYSFWTDRRDNVVDVIRRTGPAILALQEVTTLTQEGPVRSAQLEFLRAALPEYRFSGAQPAGPYSAQPIAFKRSAFAFSEEGFLHFSVSGEPSDEREWGAWLPRFASWVILVSDSSLIPADIRVLVVNVHYDNLAGRSRRNSSRIVAEFLEQRAADYDAAIVIGDFNSFMNARAMRVLLDSGLRHALGRTGTGSFHVFTGITPWPRVDHVLIGPEFESLGGYLIYDRYADGYPSDHFPAVATLRWW